MKTVYQNQYRLRTSDFDRWNRIYPSSVLDLFQDVAGQHARELNIALGPDSGTDLIWVLAKTKYQNLCTEFSCRNVNVRTWPHKPQGVNFRRDYVIESDDGTPLIKGTSDWVVINALKRKIALIKDLYPFADTEFCTDSTFDGKLPRLNITDATDNECIIRPGFTDIDINNHVNNTKYANFVLNSILPQKDNLIDTFRIDYHKEILFGSEVCLHTKKDGNFTYTVGQNNSGENLFTCEIKWA